MTATEREQVRLSLLRYCAAADRFGLHVAFLLQAIRNEGFRVVDLAELERELEYLVEKGLVAAAEKPISPDLRTFRATAAGRDYLAARGIA